MIRFFSIILLCFPHFLGAQYNLLFQQQDTLSYKYRTGGEAIDSLDNYHTNMATSVPGGGWNNPFGRLHSNYLDVLTSFQKQVRMPTNLRSHFAGLPHLGFMYGFGAKGTQYVHVDYQQTFKKNTNLSFAYDKNSLGLLTGFVRNNSYANNSIQFLVDHHSKHYEGLYYLNFLNTKRNLSGGIITDTVIETLGIIYTPVFKINARSEMRNLEVGTQHQINFNKDSLVRHGLAYHNEWSIENREFFESDSLDKIYPSYNFSPTDTRDQYQLASIRNAGGYFLKTTFMKLEALVEHRYWKFQNIGTVRDTTELRFLGNAGFQFGKIKLNNHIAFNFVGAVGEFKNVARASYVSKYWKHNAQFVLDRSLPSVFMRQYIGNNVGWQLSDWSLQTKTGFDYQVNWTKKFDLSGTIGWRNYANSYFYVGDTWRNDTLTNFSVISTAVKGSFSWKSFTLQPFVTYNVTGSSVSFIPNLDARAKLFFNKALFKAKKFNYILGVDVRYLSSYGLIGFAPAVDMFVLPTSTTMNEAQFKLDVFTGFQIDNFRFYVKAENLDYFWSNKRNLLQVGYPTLPLMLRLGITWDFFN